jgi:cysteinyl-tRNA synthetase
LALACLHETASALRKCAEPAEQSHLLAVLRDGAELLGLLQQDPVIWRTVAPPDASGPNPEQIEQLMAARRDARSKRDFVRADELRGELLALGIGIDDNASGTTWHRIHA